MGRIERFSGEGTHLGEHCTESLYLSERHEPEPENWTTNNYPNNLLCTVHPQKRKTHFYVISAQPNGLELWLAVGFRVKELLYVVR